MIRSCKNCNDRFGSGFEAAVAKNLAPLIVLLSRAGYKHPRLVVHKRAYIDEKTGFEYDLNSHGKIYLSKPYPVKENDVLKGMVYRNVQEANKHKKLLDAKGLKCLVTEQKLEIPLSSIRGFRLMADPALRRLAVKICYAFAALMKPGLNFPSGESRQFLLGESQSSNVQQLPTLYPSLDKLRSPLAHLVYIEGISKLGECFGVVQLFGGFFQLYIPLSDIYSGADFAYVGTLDITSFQEKFQEIEGLSLPKQPRQMDAMVYFHQFLERVTDFHSQVVQKFGVVMEHLEITISELGHEN